MRLVDGNGRLITMQIDAFIQVRMTSTRVPRKALVPLAGEACLDHVVRRVARAKCLSHVVICTSAEPVDDALVDEADALGVSVFRGDADDCVDRFLRCAEAFESDVIVRICGDSPLVAPEAIDGGAGFLVAEQLDYVWSPSLPVGTYVEFFTAAALQRAALTATNRAVSDDLTYFLRRTEINRVGEYEPPASLRRPDLVLALNRPEDLAMLQEVFEHAAAPGEYLPLADAISYLDAHPEVAALNAGYVPQATRCDTRLDPSRLPLRPPELAWYAPIGVGGTA